jgi:putative endonuclease
MLGMFFVYVLYSSKFARSYVGISEDVEQRLKEHNSGKSTYTSKFKPWILIYKEPHESRNEARKREKYLKTAAGRRWMNNNIEWPRSSTG